MDRIVSAHEEAAHRVGLILRHGQLPDIFRSRGAELTTLQFYNLDVIAGCFGVLFGIVFAVKRLLLLGK